MSQVQSYAEFYRRSIEDRDAFWTEQAALVDWKKPFDRVCNHDNPPFARWFEGGLTNLCHNAVDRHLKDRPDQNAGSVTVSGAAGPRCSAWRRSCSAWG